MAFAQKHLFATGTLVDADLELVLPDMRYVDPLLAACNHPLTRSLQPDAVTTTRGQAIHMVRNYGAGFWPGDPMTGVIGGYHYWMKSTDPGAIAIAGGIGLRISKSADIELYYGHIGYHVYPPARGRRYAERATRLIAPLAKRHGMTEIWITTNPENTASRRTCERLGATLVETVQVPEQHPLYLRGDRRKCRYRYALGE